MRTMRWQTLTKRIGQNMKRLRLERNLTQEAAADRSKNLTLRYWQFLEAGEKNFTVHKLVAVARALKVDPSELLKK